MHELAEILIRLSTASTMILYGITQIVRPQQWFDYLPKFTQKILGSHSVQFMKSHGWGNLSLGLLFALNIQPQLVYWLVLIWWISILPFAFYKDWQDGMRDVVIIAGIIALISITIAK